VQVSDAPAAAVRPRQGGRPVPPAPAEAAAARSGQPPQQDASGAGSLAPPRLLFADVDPAGTPVGLGRGWLIVAEPPPAAAGMPAAEEADPFAGEAGRLLANMLRAMQLHRHPRVYLSLLRPAGQGGGRDTLLTALEAALAAVQPDMVLLMGRVAAQALLQSGEPLGRLRGAIRHLPGLQSPVPALATYDAPYLLRAQPDKARAWEDLCLALQAVRQASGAAAEPPHGGS
jgi:uracil-DNA glycosylase